MSLLLLFCSHWPGLQKHDFIDHFLRQYFQKCHYSARELAFSVPRCHPNNTVSEEVKLVEIASRVMKDRFASSVNNSDLWNDDLTKRVSLLFRILCSAQWSCPDPDGKWEWWWKAPIFSFYSFVNVAFSIAAGRSQVVMDLFSSLLAAERFFSGPESCLLCN